MSKSIRSEALVLEELEQTMQNIVSREEELKKSNETLNSLKKQLKLKEKALSLQNQEAQEQFDLLQEELQAIKKKQLDLHYQEDQAISDAFSVIIQDAETELSKANSAKEEQIEEYSKIDKTIKELQQKEALFIDVAEAERKISLIKLVKDNLNDLSQIDSGNGQDQEVIKDIVRKIEQKKDITHKEDILDDLIFEEEQSLAQKLSDVGENRESLNDFAQSFIELSNEANMRPEDFLNYLISSGKDRKEETLEKITLLEQEESSLNARLEKLKELKSTVYEIDQIPQEIIEEFAEKRRLLLQRENEIYNKLIEAENSELGTIDKIVKEINSVKESIELQEGKVKNVQKILYQEEEALEELQKEHKKLLKKPKVEKNQEEEIPEQFYLSTSPQFSELSKTIKNRKELNQLKKQFENEKVLLEEQIFQLNKENNLQKSTNSMITKELENARRLNQEQQERIDELEKQIALSEKQGPSLADEMRELENQSYTEELSELQSLIKMQNTEIDSLNKMLEVKEKEQQLKQEELDRIKESQNSLNEERDELAQKLSKTELAIGKEKSDKKQLESKVTQLTEKLKESELARSKASEKQQNALTEMQSRLEEAEKALKIEQQSKGEKVEALQNQLEQLTREKDELVEKNKLTNQQLNEDLIKLGSEKTKVQEELHRIKESQNSLNEEKDELVQKLSKTEKAIEKEKSDKEQLESKVTQLTEKLKESELARSKASEKQQNALTEMQSRLGEAEKISKESSTEIDNKSQKVHNLEQLEVNKKTNNKILDNVSIVSSDQILQDFRELRRIQRDVVVGSKAVGEAPEGNEAFHKYASQHGSEIGNALNPEVSELMGAIEREKYQEIHQKYPHKNIEWKEGNQASITKDGIEICKLSDKPVIDSNSTNYKLENITITNYRNLDLPLKAKGGPMHMSLAVKDLQGRNISNKDAVYFTAHYNEAGKLVEMTTPIPVYFTGTSKDSPVCIKRKGKIYTLPINRGKYEEMSKEIEINKGIGIEAIKKTKAQDSIILGPKANKLKNLIPDEVVTTLKTYNADHHGAHTIVNQKKAKDINGPTK